MHYFQFLLKGKKNPAAKPIRPDCGIYSASYIQTDLYPGRLHNTLSQHSLNHLLKSGDISTSHIVACNLIALCCL